MQLQATASMTDQSSTPARPAIGLADPVTSVASVGGAIEAAYDRCAAGLFRYVFVRLGRDAAAADDVMQQLWLAAVKNAHSVPAAELEFWLRGVAGRLIADHFRKAYRVGGARGAVSMSAAEAAGLASRLERDDAADPLADTELRNRLALAITELPAEEQDLLMDHYVRQRSQADLARDRGVSERGIEGRLYRLRRSLLDCLRGWR